MARGKLLVGFQEAIAPGLCFTFSWGPFSGPHRITHMRFHHGLTINVENTVGVFVSASAEGFEGSAVLPMALPTSWTPIGDPPNVGGTSVRSQNGQLLPFRHDTSTDSIILTDLSIDVTGSGFYVKALARNTSGAGLAFRAVICIVANPADAEPDAIDVRPIPGTQPPTGEPPTTPPTLPPGTPPPEPPPEPTGPAKLPEPGELTMPPITIDYKDPIGSVREIGSK